MAPRIDPGTDLEDELSDPADSPAVADHGVAPLSTPADVDIDLEQVFGDVGSLATMVTPIGDFDELIVAQPPMGWADSCVSWLSATTDRVGGLSVGAADSSGGVHAAEEPVARGC